MRILQKQPRVSITFFKVFRGGLKQTLFDFDSDQVATASWSVRRILQKNLAESSIYFQKLL